MQQVAGQRARHYARTSRPPHPRPYPWTSRRRASCARPPPRGVGVVVAASLAEEEPSVAEGQDGGVPLEGAVDLGAAPHPLDDDARRRAAEPVGDWPSLRGDPDGREVATLLAGEDHAPASVAVHRQPPAVPGVRVPAHHITAVDPGEGLGGCRGSGFGPGANRRVTLVSVRR